jgi:hypothetical protein
MYKSLFAHSPLLILPLIALGIFVGVFAAVVIRTYWRKAAAYESLAKLPLGDDDRPHSATAAQSALLEESHG